MFSGRRTSRLILRIALMMMLLIAVIAPLGFYFVSYQYLAGSLDSEARYRASVITGIISTNPDMWELEQLRLDEILSKRSDRRYRETWRILNLKKEVVAKSVSDLGFPVIERRLPLLDAGVVAGTLVIQRSLKPLLMQTIFVGAASMILGIVVFVFIRVIPIRALELKEKELRLSDKKLRSLVTTVEKRHFIYQHDREMTFTYLSASISTILGYSPQEFKTNYAAYLTDHPINKSVRAFNQYSLTGEVQPPYELEIYHKDGRRIWLEVVELPLMDDSDMVTGLQGIGQDISDRKKAAETHRIEVQIETMRKIIKGLSHEIRNPLFGISSVSQILGREIADEKLLPMVSALSTESARIANLIRELNMYVSPKSPAISRVDMTSSIERIRHKLSAKYRHVDFTVTLEPSLTLEADEALLAHAIEELLENSCQAGADKIVLTISRSGEQSRIDIRDNGRGMSEGELSECCEPFHTTKRSSSGLGLPLSKKIIEAHGGRFSLTSEPGEGTAIRILI